MKFNLKTFIITIIIGLLIIARGIKFGQNPIALYWDELAIGFDAQAIVQTGMDIHGRSWLQPIFLSYGDYKAPLAIWLVSLSFKLFGQSEWALRLPFAIISFAGILAAYLFTKTIAPKLTKHKSLHTMIPILTTIFLLTTPWHYHFSRIGFESGLSLNLLLVTIYFTYLGLNKKPIYFIPASIFSAATIYAYISARYILPIFIITLFVANIKQTLNHKFWIAGLIGFYLLIQIPIYNSPFYEASQQYRWSAQNILTDGKTIEQSAQLIADHGNTLSSRIFYHRYLMLGKSILHNYTQHFTADFIFLTGDPNLRHHTGWGGELLIITAPFILLGLYFVLKNFKQPLSIITLIWLAASPLTAILPYEVPHASRAIYMLIPLTLIFSFGLVQFFELTDKISKSLITSIIIILILINFTLYLEDYFNHYPVRSAAAWQLGNKYIGQIVKESKADFDAIIIPSDFWMPINSILFYNPDLTLQIQQQTINTEGETLWWKDQDINNIHFHPLSESQQNTLILTTDESQTNGHIQELYLYPDSSPLLYKIYPDKDNE